MPKPKRATHKVRTPTVFGGSLRTKLKAKNVQMKLKTGSATLFTFFKFSIVAMAYNAPNATKKYADKTVVEYITNFLINSICL